MSFVEQPVCGGAIPPGDRPQAGPDGIEHPACPVEWHAPQPARFDRNHVLAWHPGSFREHALRQLLTLTNEAQQTADAEVIRTCHEWMVAGAAWLPINASVVGCPPHGDDREE
jgi:hypothetical protein